MRAALRPSSSQRSLASRCCRPARCPAGPRMLLEPRARLCCTVPNQCPRSCLGSTLPARSCAWRPHGRARAPPERCRAPGRQRCAAHAAGPRFPRRLAVGHLAAPLPPARHHAARALPGHQPALSVLPLPVRARPAAAGGRLRLCRATVKTEARVWMSSACAKPRCRQPGTAAAAHRLSQPCAPRQGSYRSREPGQQHGLLLDKPSAMSLAGRRLACRTPSNPQHYVPKHPSPSTSAAQARGLPHGLPAVRAAGGPARVGPAGDARRGRHGPAAPARHQADAGRARLLPGWRAPSPTRRCRARNDNSLLFLPCNFSFYSTR